MNKAIANILKDALAGLPVVDRVAGLVQIAEYHQTVYDEEGRPSTTIKRVPFSQDMQYDPECESNDLVPDDSKRGILYFEDSGTMAIGGDGTYFGFSSSLRLVCWINGRTLSSPRPLLVPAMIAHICDILTSINNTHSGMFLGLVVKATAIPPQTPAIFAPYTYDVYSTQFVMPPFEYFAIDLKVDYKMHKACIETIQFTADECS